MFVVSPLLSIARPRFEETFEEGGDTSFMEFGSPEGSEVGTG